ncbi:MAG TPA: response regulator [Gemmatimonadales bacterium]|nr:response regulator [Gemmatimonadales bacterium]
MTRLRALIVDDERLARKELGRLLGRHPEIEIAGEAANAKEARKAVVDLEPDVLFLDVQMPGETGFELLASLDSVPLVVFTTAYDEYALNAFEVSALDYLLKPIDPERLARTVDRLMSAAPSARAFPDRAEVRLSEQHRVFVAQGERYWLVGWATSDSSSRPAILRACSSEARNRSSPAHSAISCPSSTTGCSSRPTATRS